MNKELFLPFLDEMSKHANWCRKNVSEVANCTCPAEGAAFEAAQIRQHIAELTTPPAAPSAEALTIEFFNCCKCNVSIRNPTVAQLMEHDHEGNWKIVERDQPSGALTPEQVHAMCAYLSTSKHGWGCSKCVASVDTPYGPGEIGCYGIALETLEKAREILNLAPSNAPRECDLNRMPGE